MWEARTYIIFNKMAAAKNIMQSASTDPSLGTPEEKKRKNMIDDDDDFFSLLFFL